MCTYTFCVCMNMQVHLYMNRILHGNRQNLNSDCSGEGTILEKRSTLYPLNFATIICIHYIFNALMYLELFPPPFFRNISLEKMRMHVLSKRSLH